MINITGNINNHLAGFPEMIEKARQQNLWFFHKPTYSMHSCKEMEEFHANGVIHQIGEYDLRDPQDMLSLMEDHIKYLRGRINNIQDRIYWDISHTINKRKESLNG